MDLSRRRDRRAGAGSHSPDPPPALVLVRGRQGRPGIDWSRLATAVDTLVILMAARTLPRIARELIAHGRPSDTPVAVMRSHAMGAATITTTLGAVSRGIDVAPPVAVVVGEVVRLRESLGLERASAVHAVT